MALPSKSNKNTAAKDTPSTDAPVEKKVPQKEAPAKKASKEVVATPRGGAVATSAGKVVMPLAEFKEALPPFDFGTLPKIKADQGSLDHEDDGDIGNGAVIELVSLNTRYVVGANDNSADYATTSRHSTDGETLNDDPGTTVGDWIQELKDEDWPKAGMKKYIDLVGILESTEEKCSDIGNMVTFQCSPESIKMLDRLDLNILTANRGKTPAEIQEALRGLRISVSAKKKKYGDSISFSLLVFSLV